MEEHNETDLLFFLMGEGGKWRQSEGPILPENMIFKHINDLQSFPAQM